MNCIHLNLTFTFLFFTGMEAWSQAIDPRGCFVFVPKTVDEECAREGAGRCFKCSCILIIVVIVS
jgi:hypothetical protein